MPAQVKTCYMVQAIRTMMRLETEAEAEARAESDRKSKKRRGRGYFLIDEQTEISDSQTQISMNDFERSHHVVGH